MAKMVFMLMERLATNNQCYVLFGTNKISTTFGKSFNLSLINGSNGFVISYSFMNKYGWLSGHIGQDFNGDGYSDIVIGASFADSNNLNSSGQSYVIFGTSSPVEVFGDSFSLSALDGENGFKINGIAAEDGSGGFVSMQGDFNGDGYSDIAIGASFAEVDGTSRCGQSYVLFCTDDPLSTFGPSFNLSSLDGANGFTINGKAVDESSGHVNLEGDFNGDGYSDLYIGAVGADANGVSKSGRGYLLFGTSNAANIFGSSFGLLSIDGKNGFEINGIAENDASGWPASMGGDFNMDGYYDLVVTAFEADGNGLSHSGQCYVLFGTNDTWIRYGVSFNLSSLDGANGFVINGPVEKHRFGRTVSFRRDTTGDGFSNLLIAAIDMTGANDRGRVYFFTIPTFCSNTSYLQPYPDNTTCEEFCPQGTWANDINRTCDSCHPLCATCQRPQENACTTCTTEYYFDNDSNMCLTQKQLFNLIELEEALLLTTSTTSNCPSCSGNGHCEYFKEYVEDRCICKSGYMGPSCSHAQTNVLKVLDKKMALLNLIEEMMNTNKTRDVNFTMISSYIADLLKNPVASDSSLIGKCLQLTQHMITLNHTENNFEQLPSQVLNNLLDVSTNSLETLHQTDCLLEDSNTKELYNRSLDLVQQIGSVNLARMRESPDETNILENDHISLFSDTMTLSQLNVEQTKVTRQDDLPAFLLEYDATFTSDAANIEEEVDVQAILWKKNTFYCPNDSKATSVSVFNVEIYEEGTDIPHPVVDHTRLKAFYPLNSGKGCQTACSRVMDASLEMIECHCPKLSEISLKRQLLSVFENSNLRKLANLSAIKDFEASQSAVFWVLVAIFMWTCFYSLTLSRKQRTAGVAAVHRRNESAYGGLRTIILVFFISIPIPQYSK